MARLIARDVSVEGGNLGAVSLGGELFGVPCLEPPIRALARCLSSSVVTSFHLARCQLLPIEVH
ncbi:protein of unknown function [Micropruina glycogenica]|uniref:Uncharacterized protein n=1 Tax=Micropruina glycogenica TaxID=75385 RepID=A0A2N9JE37_9ACTN|nr:protein of unknown function [Micropruina glycogenica]